MQQKNSKTTQLLIVQFYDKKITLGEGTFGKEDEEKRREGNH